MMPLLTENNNEGFMRATTIHHSINGSFAIRKGDYKLIMCPGSGGWSFPRPNDKKVIDTLPKIQLYNLTTDAGEKNNLEAKMPKKVEELKQLLTQQILDGRSSQGEKQQNDTGDSWKQLWWMNEKS